VVRNAFGRGWVLGQPWANTVTSLLGRQENPGYLTTESRPLQGREPDKPAVSLCCFREPAARVGADEAYRERQSSQGLLQAIVSVVHAPTTSALLSLDEAKAAWGFTVGVAPGAQAALKPRLTLPISLRGCNTHHQHSFSNLETALSWDDQKEPSSRIPFTRVSAHPSIRDGNTVPVRLSDHTCTCRVFTPHENVFRFCELPS
jgi:hypothetical protein